MSDETQRMDFEADFAAADGDSGLQLSIALAEARRARRREAEALAKLARVQRVAENFGHVEDCSRMGECDETDDGEECGYHGNEEPCPPCECGKGEILGILAAPEVPCSKCGKPGCEPVAGVAPLCDDCFPLAAPEGK